MTVDEYLHSIINAPADMKGVGTYQAHIKNLATVKRGKHTTDLIRITIEVITADFRPVDALNGLEAWVSLVRADTRARLIDQGSRTPTPTQAERAKVVAEKGR